MLSLLKRKQVGTNDLDGIISTLKAFYEEEAPTAEVIARGRVEKLKISTDENFHQTENFIGITISRPAFETIRLYASNFYLHHDELFKSSGPSLREPLCGFISPKTRVLNEPLYFGVPI